MSLLPRKSRAISPFNLFDDDFDRMFEGVFLPTRPTAQQEGAQAASPRIDIEEKPDAFHIKADLPGLERDDIELTLQEGVLTLSATKEDEYTDKEGGEVVRRERYFGRYLRQIPLGKNIDEQQIRADFKNGVLNIKVPKREPESAERVRIEVG